MIDGILGPAAARGAKAIDVVKALRSTGRLDKATTLIYRCANGCLLARVVDTPQGVIVICPPYRLPPAANEKLSSPAGREHHTRDGNRSWNEQVFFTDQAANVPIHCEHIIEGYLPLERVHANIRPGRNTVVLHKNELVFVRDIL